MENTNLEILKNRLKQAWQNFENKATQQQIDSARQVLKKHSDALFASTTKSGIKPSEFSLVISILEETLEGDIKSLLSKFVGDDQKNMDELKQDIELKPRVLADGEILGFGKYEVLDYHWTEASIVWLENYFDDRDFPTPGTWLTIPDQISLAIFGDWGGGTWDDNAVAQNISTAIKNLKPDYSIHLGDVYYAGESDQEQTFLLNLWPTAQTANFTLNSNHEMYPNGKGYFETALPNSYFEVQGGKSFFALENTNWIIVGLDSAFHADINHLYLQGAISTEQSNFLSQVAAKDKQVIVMCHHNPLDITGKIKNPLWDQVAGMLGDNLKYWYWGHIHGGAVYKAMDGVNCRLVGHGVIPWGNAKSLADSSAAVWYENTPANNSTDDVRVQNGFAVITLDDSSMQETFYGENGESHWTSQH